MQRDDAEITKLYVLIDEYINLERVKVNEREMLRKSFKIIACLRKGRKMVVFIWVIHSVDGDRRIVVAIY